MSVECILNRRSVREYTSEEITEAQLHSLLRAGMYAPSAMNSQPWEFIVVRSRALLTSLSEVVSYWHMLKNAPLAIVVVANLSAYRSSNREFFVQDCAASTQNILNAAEGLGLGSVWLGLYGIQDRMDQVRALLGIPPEIIPFSVIPIGHPAVHPAPHTSFYQQKVHLDRY